MHKPLTSPVAFVWVWNVVFHTKGSTEIGGVWE